MLLQVVARIRGGVNFRPEDGQRLMAMKEGGMWFSLFFLFSQCVHFSKKSFCTRCLSGACITLSKARTTWRWRILGTNNIPSIYPNLLHPGPLWDHLGLVCSGALQPWSSDMFPFRYCESGTEATKPTQLFTSPASNQNVIKRLKETGKLMCVWSSSAFPAFMLITGTRLQQVIGCHSCNLLRHL